jgi:hypothetical protein
MIDPEGEDESVAAALRRLPREITPPPHVRAAVARRVPSRGGRAAFRMAVAASLLVAAFLAGRATAPATSTPAAGQKFALLLYGGAAGGGDDRASEYAAWAVGERNHGRQISGERLADAGWSAGQPMIDPAPLRGFFIIRARDAAEALELAHRHPHARGGTVIVRPIDTPN